jgi:hypothetical protein
MLGMKWNYSTLVLYSNHFIKGAYFFSGREVLT